ncbi:MAG TPA: PHB depolymerase family esterase [Caulobacteraceae bacterium]|nr:PHB depolymerase family esterase [Caulobacteraceae bacterium]
MRGRVRTGASAAALALAVMLAAMGPAQVRAADAAAAVPEAPALVRNTISVGGVERSYSYFASSKANSWTGGPVVFALHDNGQTAQEFAVQSGWMKVAEDGGFAVVFPEAANRTWAANSGGEAEYLKAVFEHARTGIVSRFPGDRAPANPAGGGGGPTRVPASDPLRYLTGVGAGAIVAEEFAIDQPGRIAAIATLDGVAFDAAYLKGDEPAQAFFLHNRVKNESVAPHVAQLKKQVPLAAWLFTTGAATPAQAKQAEYWKQSNGVAGPGADREIGGFRATVFRNPANPAQEVRTSAVPLEGRYGETMASTLWTDFFSRVVRWPSAPNGDLTAFRTEAEIDKAFEQRTIDLGEGRASKYYVKLPSSYRKGQSLPVVVSAHGGVQPAWLYINQIRMDEVGEKEGFITVYPQGPRNFWLNRTPDGPDPKFIELLVKDVIATYGADPTRIYMQGFSQGSGLTQLMGLTRPQMFAAIAPMSALNPFAQEVQDRVDEVAQRKIRIPMILMYGAVDAATSVDGEMPARGQLRTVFEGLKAYNNVTTPDKVERINSIHAAPYDYVIPQGKPSRAGVDKTYPDGRFKVYEYMSADRKPLNLLTLVWGVDLTHATDPREAQLAWDYMKKWRRNRDGTLTYTAAP